jgi:hypothetical protein
MVFAPPAESRRGFFVRQGARSVLFRAETQSTAEDAVF